MNRDEFTELVYETFADEPDNVLANGIIEAADAYVEYEKAQLSQEGTTKDAISRMETVKHLRRVLDATVPITDYDGGFVDGVEFGISTVSTMPTIQPEERTEECTETHACDLIDRPAAQTELMMKCERYTLARESHGMGHVEWSSDLISVADAMDAIRDLPPAQTEPHWIPVSERVPEEHESIFAKYYNTPKWNNCMWLKESDQMLVSVEVPGNEVIVDKAKMIDDKWFFGLSFVDKKVIAWMPLPEPYKPNK